MSSGRAAAGVFTLVILVATVVAVVIARGWPSQARLFPTVVGIPMIVLLAGQLLADVTPSRLGWARRGVSAGPVDVPVDDSVPGSVVVGRSLAAFAWLLGLGAGIALIGFNIAIPAFVCAYLVVRARASLVHILAGTGFIVLALVVIFNKLVSMRWPEPLFPGPEEAVIRLLGG